MTGMQDLGFDLIRLRALWFLMGVAQKKILDGTLVELELLVLSKPLKIEYGIKLVAHHNLDDEVWVGLMVNFTELLMRYPKIDFEQVEIQYDPRIGYRQAYFILHPKKTEKTDQEDQK